MRYPSAIILSALTWQVAGAGDLRAIEWNEARRLSWDDFTGSVPSNTDRNRVAETSASLAWSYEYSLEWSRDRCAFRIVDIQTSAQFHPETSWVREGHRNEQVLAHEQGHFDVTEVYRKRFTAVTREYVGSRRNCSGRNERAAKRSAESEIAELLGSIYENVWRQYRREQESYDAGTRHGIDIEAQAEWSEKISASLNGANLR